MKYLCCTVEASVLVVVCISLVPAASRLVGNNATVDYRASQTLNGLFEYYWKHDTVHKNVEFFFVCAQLGGISTPGSCTCKNPRSCVECYRWWSAIALESVATYGIYTHSKNYSAVPDMIFSHSPYNSAWNASAACTFIDDFTWYGIAYLRVYDWLNDSKWLQHAIDLHDWAWEYGWDDSCGGFLWNNCVFQSFKDSIVTVEMLHLASKLAYMIRDVSRFLDAAETIWNWFFSFNNGYGLMSDRFLVLTGVVPERCCNASSSPYTKCHSSNVSGTAYNQGLLMSAAAYLYLTTANKTFLQVGIRAVEAILANYTTADGILIDEARSYQTYSYDCYAGSDPGGDWYSFNGILMLHLGYFTELLAKNGSLPQDLLNRIYTLVQKTSDAAWAKSAVYPPFKPKSNACSPGSNPADPKTKYPKFHWWWNKNVVNQTIPPDPRYYFHKLELRCTGNNTQVWDGHTGSEINCTEMCNGYNNCSKYLYQNYETTVTTDCWLWSYNRSDHICGTHGDYYDFNVGIKRPIGNATCAGKCGSKAPQALIDNTTCYCDSSCAQHLDCCIDYADHCLTGQPTCKGNCGMARAQPIPGGGYCWCDYYCNPWFTDNNSDGSCCPDYPRMCNEVVMPTCLDARTQGSALNLFLAHMSISRTMGHIKRY